MPTVRLVLFAVVVSLLLVAIAGCSSSPSSSSKPDAAILFPVAGFGSAGFGPAPTDAGEPVVVGTQDAETGMGDADTDAAADGGDQDAAVDAAVPPPPPCVCDGSEVLDDRCKAECATTFEVLYASTQLPAFYLTIPDDNGADGSTSWDLMAACTEEEAAQVMPPAHCDEQIGSFHAEYDPDPSDAVDETVTTPELDVGIRRKGRASWQDLDQKASFKVKFTAFGGERFMGLTALTLNNMIQDPSALHERVAYRVFRAAGVVAPLANNARVYVRKGATLPYEFYGVYANVQTLDKRFVVYNFGEVGGEVGNLYDTYNYDYFFDLDRSSSRSQAGTAPGAQEARFQLETNETANDISDLTQLIDAVHTDSLFPQLANNAQFVEDFSNIGDITAFLRMFAAQALIADWDGFPGARNNYKLYHDLVRNRFVMLPWGTDQTFGRQDGVYQVNWKYDLEHTNSNRTSSLFMIRCVADSNDCLTRYHTEVSSALATFDSAALIAVVDVWEAQIQDALALDTKKPYSDDDFHRNVTYLRDYISKRGACVTAQLGGKSCANVSCPVGSSSDCQ